MRKLLLELLLALGIVIAGVLSRTTWHLGENIEFVTAIGLSTAFFFARSWLAVVIPLVIMVVSDLIIGNDGIVWFTWSAYLVLPFLGLSLKWLRLKDWAQNLVGVQLSGIVFTLFFFLWTNLGVVLTTNMYAKDFSGLQTSYLNALPFLQNQLLGNLLIVPLLFLIVLTVYKLRETRFFNNDRDANKEFRP